MGVSIAKGTASGIQITGTAATQEYSINGGAWVSCTGATVDNIAANIGDTVAVRIKTTGATPAGNATSSMVVTAVGP
jgi:GH24 family phage-related lysozyme (muramidase)